MEKASKFILQQLPYVVIVVLEQHHDICVILVSGAQWRNFQHLHSISTSSKQVLAGAAPDGANGGVLHLRRICFGNNIKDITEFKEV